MNSIGELLAFKDPDFLLLTKAQRTLIQTTVMLYLFRGCKSQYLSKVLVEHLDWKGQDCIDFRKALSHSGYIQKNLKLYLYAKVTQAKVKHSDYGVPLRDAVMVSKIITGRTEAAINLLELLLNYKAKGARVLTIDSFDRGLNMALVMLKKDAYSAKFIRKKFLFLTQSGQRDEDSLSAEFTEFALRAAYRAYPKIDSLLHLINIMKQAIHNRGINILKEETTQGRQRVKKNEDGTYQGTLLSLQFTNFEQTFGLEQMGTGSLSVCNSLMCGIDGQSAEYERPGDIDRRRDLREVVAQLYDRVNGEKPKQFMDLLMGEHHPEFSDWLGQPNEEAVFKMDRRIYVEKVREFMDVPQEVARDFMLKLRMQLADFRN